MEIDPESGQHFYYIKYTVIDYSNTERRPSAIFYMNFEAAKLVHRYYGTNVFQSESLTTKNTLSQFLPPGMTRQAPLESQPSDDSSGGSVRDSIPDLADNPQAIQVLMATAENVAAMSEILNKNPFFILKPREAKALLDNPFLQMKNAVVKKVIKALMKIADSG